VTDQVADFKFQFPSVAGIGSENVMTDDVIDLWVST
jgi:hypothetical protein